MQGDISFWLGFGLCLGILLAPCGCRRDYCGPHCGCESVRVLASLLGSYPSGVRHLSRFVPQFGALSESLTHSIPRSFLVESLSAYAVGLSVALWLCPGVPSAFLCIGLVCRSRSQCRPSSAVSSLTVSVLCVRLLLRRGVSPYVGFRRSPWGSRWLHLYRLTPGLVSLRDFTVRHLELRSVFHTFPARRSACRLGDNVGQFP